MPTPPRDTELVDEQADSTIHESLSDIARQYDPRQAKSESARRGYIKQKERHGQDIICEWCGKTYRVHPAHRNKSWNCSPYCRNNSRRRALKTGEGRVRVPLPWEPWKHVQKKETP